MLTREIQQTARQAANEARDAAREAARAAREAAAVTGIGTGNQSELTVQPTVPVPPVPPAAPLPPGTIVIPTDGGNNITISVDGSGIHVNQGDASTTIPIHDVVPRGAVDIVQAFGATLVLLVVGWPIARAIARRMDRKHSAAVLSQAVQQRLDAMDRNIDTVAVELERVSEGQRFTAKLLEQRPVDHAKRTDS